MYFTQKEFPPVVFHDEMRMINCDVLNNMHIIPNAPLRLVTFTFLEL